MEFYKNKILISLFYIGTYQIVANITGILMGIKTGGSTPATLFFPPPAITYAFMLYFGLYIIPLAPINVLILTILHHRPIYTIILLPLFTLIFYGGAGIVLKDYIKINIKFKRLQDSLYFLLITAIADLFLGFSFGLSRILFEDAALENLPFFTIDWFLGDIVGIYSLTPFLLIIIFPLIGKIIFNDLNKKYFQKELLDYIKIVVFISIFTGTIFFQSFYKPSTILFLFFIPLTTIALLSGLRGAIITNVTIILEVITILKVLPNGASLLEFQMVIFSLSSVALIIGVVISERTNYLNSIEALVKERTIQLENTNKELEFFSYSVSHDLRTPLTTMDNIMYLFTNESNNQLDQETIDLISRLKKNTHKMQVLIDDLLNFFTLNQKKVEKEIIEMKSLVQSVFETITDNLQISNLSFEVDQEIPNCLGDPILISVILNNLISNAIKFTSKIEKAIIRFGSFKNKDGELVYFIKDNGVGFDMEDATKLFNAFQRLHPEYDGTGIGLSLVSRIITRHGGKIWAEAKPNQGATFYFTL